MQEQQHEELKAINTFIDSYIKNNSASFDDVIESLMLLRQEKDQILIPSCILREKKLGILESVTKYLKESLKMKYFRIANLIKKDPRVVWVTYNKALKKKKTPLKIKKPNLWVPVSVFYSRRPLESLVKFLKDNKQMNYNEIAKLLDRDNRVIWAVYNRGGKKR